MLYSSAGDSNTIQVEKDDLCMQTLDKLDVNKAFLISV